MSYQQLIMQRVLHDEPVRHFMNHAPIAVAPSSSVEQLVEKYIYQYHHKMFPVTLDGRLVGCVHLKDVKRVPRQDWGRHTVGEIMRSCHALPVLSPRTEAKEALSIMSQTGASRLLVAEGDRLVGVIALKDLLKILSLKLELEEEPEPGEGGAEPQREAA
jgi:predicted transcriptional regulator